MKENNLKEKYPLDKIELYFEKIEKLGYTIGATKDSCQIWDGIHLFIDADDHEDDYHLNAAEAIEAFYKN